MGTISSPGVPARCTDSIHARQTAGRTQTRNIDVPATQPPGTDQQLAEVVNSNSGPAARSETVSNSGTASRYEESLADRDKAPERTEPSVREDNHLAGLPPDCGYGPSLWTGELDTRRNTRAEERRVGYIHTMMSYVSRMPVGYF